MLTATHHKWKCQMNQRWSNFILERRIFPIFFIVSVLLSFITARKEEQTKNHTMEHDIYHNSGGFIFDECVAEKNAIPLNKHKQSLLNTNIRRIKSCHNDDNDIMFVTNWLCWLEFWSDPFFLSLHPIAVCFDSTITENQFVGILLPRSLLKRWNECIDFTQLNLPSHCRHCCRKCLNER